jgi:hypothetical protein
MAAPKTPDIILSAGDGYDPSARQIGENVSTPPTYRDASPEDIARPFSPQTIYPDQIVRFENKMEEEAFMLDELTVVFASPGRDQSTIGERFIPLTVRDMRQTIVLGGRQKIKRCFVELLARCREASVTGQSKVVDGSDGKDYLNTTEFSSSMLKHFFTVAHDPRGEMGRTWLDGIMAQRV